MMRKTSSALFTATAALLSALLFTPQPSRAASGSVVITMQPGRAWAASAVPDRLTVEGTTEACVTIAVRTYLRRYSVALAYESTDAVTVAAAPAGSGDCASVGPLVGLPAGGQAVQLWRGLSGSMERRVWLRLQRGLPGSGVVEIKPDVSDI